MTRCPWAKKELDILYHDQEWGVPNHTDRSLFELLILEGAQAGLSWSTVLAKRENYRRAFDAFDPVKIVAYDATKVAELMSNAGIIRNRLKINSAIGNAIAYLKICEEFGSFDAYLWRFVGNQPIQNAWRDMTQIPARTAESDAMSRDLLRRDFKFVGSTICYAFMQATGMVNDHLIDCPRHAELDRIWRFQAR